MKPKEDTALEVRRADSPNTLFSFRDMVIYCNGNGSNIQIGGGNTYNAGADLHSLHETIQAQAAIIQAQQKTIDRLLTMIEKYYGL